jgi:hypothetical protein
MKIFRKSGRAESSSGGKDYHLVRVETADRRGMFITRYGRKGQWGVGFEVFNFDNVEDARKAWAAKHREKLEKAYREHFIDSEKEAHSADDLGKILGPQYWTKLGPANLTWLVPGIDTKGSREEPAPEFEQDANGRYRLKDRKRRLIEEKPEERAKDNALWGIF